MAADGTNQQRIRAGSWAPRVSRDGRLVVTSFLGEVPVPATLQLDGSGYALLGLTDATLQFNDPWAWSPDGTRIAGEGGNGTGGPRAGIYTVRSSDGGGIVRVDASPGRREFPIAYSPDGSKILFLRQVQRGDHYEGPMGVFVVNTNGTGVRRLNPSGTMSGLIDTPLVAAPSWSPDGRQVAFTAARATRGPFLNSDRAVFVVGVNGTQPKRITPWGNTFNAVWSPDGRWIAFETPGGPPDLSVVHPDGSGLAPVMSKEDGLFSFGPVWSPDSTRILFVRGTDDFDTTDLWTVNVDGSEPVQVTHAPGPYNSYSWVPSLPGS